ncbi:hypothetical protein K3495_g14689 [Podosphaera aphanis]|nr:hypothetical protein K3495_g14689 [Podosphaera aphanis]
MLLAITFLILVSSLSFDDVLGQTFAIYIIAIAGAESAIGLAEKPDLKTGHGENG